MKIFCPIVTILNYFSYKSNESHAKNARDYFKENFFEELSECSDHLSKESVSRCQGCLESYENRLDAVDGPCMIHRDFRPGNMIVYNGRLVGVIDWAGARFGFAEQDFCSIEHGNWPKNPEHKQALFSGLLKYRAAPNYWAIMPMLRLGRALAVIGFTVRSGRLGR